MARSPSYPQIALKQSIDYARVLYRSAHKASLDSETVLDALGFSAGSGRGFAVVSSLKQFGLLEGRDENVKVTELALRLLEPLCPAEHLSDLRAAAVSPEIFSELYTEFDSNQPSEAVVRSLALRKHGFTSTGAVKLAKSFIETFEFVQSATSTQELLDETNSGNNLMKSVDESVDSQKLDPQSTHRSNETSTELDPEVLQFKLGPYCSAKVIFDGEANAQMIDRLIAHLELSKDAY